MFLQTPRADLVMLASLSVLRTILEEVSFLSFLILPKSVLPLTGHIYLVVQ